MISCSSSNDDSNIKFGAFLRQLRHHGKDFAQPEVIRAQETVSLIFFL